jgi:hypothetical protein
MPVILTKPDFVCVPDRIRLPAGIPPAWRLLKANPRVPWAEASGTVPNVKSTSAAGITAFGQENDLDDLEGVRGTIAELRNGCAPAPAIVLPRPDCPARLNQ